MANDKRFVVKNGLRAQNVDFRSPDVNQSVLAEMLDDGRLTLSSSTEQILFLRSDGTVTLSPNNGNILIGTEIDNGVDKVQVEGTVNADNFVGDLTGSIFTNDSSILVDALTSTHYGTFIGTFQGEADGQSPNFEGDLTGSVFADDSTLLVDGLTGNHYGTFIGTFQGEADGQSPNFEGDLKGSVFADDSTLLVDGVSGQLVLDYNTTDDLSEGETNQYYTKTRVQRDSRIISLIFGS